MAEIPVHTEIGHSYGYGCPTAARFGARPPANGRLRRLTLHDELLKIEALLRHIPRDGPCGHRMVETSFHQKTLLGPSYGFHVHQGSYGRSPLKFLATSQITDPYLDDSCCNKTVLLVEFGFHGLQSHTFWRVLILAIRKKTRTFWGGGKPGFVQGLSNKRTTAEMPCFSGACGIPAELCGRPNTGAGIGAVTGGVDLPAVGKIGE